MRCLNAVFKTAGSALTGAWTTQTSRRSRPPTTKKKKKDKVRSAWISFAGRIVAQIVGAIATVALGVMVLHRYTSTDHAAGSAAEARRLRRRRPPAAANPASPPVHVIVLTPAMLGLRDADERFWAADRACAPHLDGPSTSAAHLDTGPLLSR